MRYEASLVAFDLVDQVRVTVHVWKTGDEPSGRAISLYKKTEQFQGTGESDPQEWLKDALIVILEHL